MSAEQSYTFYTHSIAAESESDRWAYTGIPDIFYGDAESARREVLALRDEVTAEPEEEWSPRRLEKIETLPISKETVLALLNDGVGSIVKSYEVIDVID
ncbi:hypothetical protein [Sinorhizobium meliloti]|uniref:Uncharacterized protein n=1 Tax=Rhizobium meliloti TaxID=382 RepID=A0A2J0YWZ9_RHIML|nr:hypothetical protein [Sinorhizobium meliloti]PJR12799.1 hypothetical protein CEJ86_24800 [Sinorhizobium meliloti]